LVDGEAAAVTREEAVREEVVPLGDAGRGEWRESCGGDHGGVAFNEVQPVTLGRDPIRRASVAHNGSSVDARCELRHVSEIALATL
jgi:hypothetical protein